MLDKYECVVANGMEADDLLAVYQTKAPPLTTIICTRDKDLRMVEGMHYGWACAKQLQWGPAPVDKLGELQLNGDKLTGTGSKFFYSQVLTGDTTDNYPGLPRCGPAKAFKLLEGEQSEHNLFKAVAGAYRDKFGDDWRGKMLEQARLAWMCTELHDDGSPIMWEIKEEWCDG
jgi:5'-3' exonuclease